jgi:hypothetical protein
MGIISLVEQCGVRIGLAFHFQGYWGKEKLCLSLAHILSVGRWGIK